MQGTDQPANIVDEMCQRPSYGFLGLVLVQIIKAQVLKQGVRSEWFNFNTI